MMSNDMQKESAKKIIFDMMKDERFDSQEIQASEDSFNIYLESFEKITNMLNDYNSLKSAEARRHAISELAGYMENILIPGLQELSAALAKFGRVFKEDR